MYGLAEDYLSSAVIGQRSTLIRINTKMVALTDNVTVEK